MASDAPAATTTTTAAAGKDAPKSTDTLTQRKNELRAIEVEVQAIWESEHTFEADAGAEGEPKYMATFPYPYMNGRLHLGHCFTLSKAEFAVAYYRLKGRRALFPFGFHCTGMPIKACADRLTREYAEGISPPKPEDIAAAAAAAAAAKAAAAAATAATAAPAAASAGAAKGGKAAGGKKGPEDAGVKREKSKVAAKTGDSEEKPKTQWEIMRDIEIAPEDIQRFSDAGYWLDYFPPLGVQDLKKFGMSIDWRRSFITTDRNPYYDAFVRWQFLALKSLANKIDFGQRYTIFSPRDNGPCADHDRAEGENVLPLEYTLIKMELQRPYPAALSQFEAAAFKVVLVPATLRPETMYGQTNCWVGPAVRYGLFRVSETEAFVCTARAARNMAYQKLSREAGVVECLAEFDGAALLGAAVSAPLSRYATVHVLPMMTVSDEKGTGVVTSVPSDSPDDWAALRDLRQKKPLREKYALRDEHVLPFEPVPIIRTPEHGDLCAVALCDKFKVASQNDRKELADAKDVAYKQGFYDGVMLVKEYEGRRVQDVKDAIREALVAAGQALAYSEPASRVTSRSGDECVVALTPQWYLTYGESAEWKAQVATALARMELFHAESRNAFVATLDWMKQWACSRTYGLGSRIPWDDKWLIESLSDSTVYMAYYTVAHLLQGGDIYGRSVGPLGIRPEQLTFAVFDYVFRGGAYPADEKDAPPEAALARLRAEFNYWYPMDLRVSGKDLVPNHLTFCLYNHTALFPESKWPRAFRANGHLLRDGVKMSKRLGNFMTLTQGVDQFSADGMRLALADAGDGVDDANFTEASTRAGIQHLSLMINFVQEHSEGGGERAKLRSGARNFFDRVFESQINAAIVGADQAYERTAYHEALRIGFFDLETARDAYRHNTQQVGGMHVELVDRYIEVALLLVAPIAPHTPEYLWRRVLRRPGSITRARFPVAGDIDRQLLAQADYLADSLSTFRAKLRLHQKKIKAPPAAAPKDITMNVFVASSYQPWQRAVITHVHSLFDAAAKTFPKDFPKQLIVLLKADATVASLAEKAMSFANEIKSDAEARGVAALSLELPFNELALLQEQQQYLTTIMELKAITISSADDAAAADPDNKKPNANPGRPACNFA